VPDDSDYPIEDDSETLSFAHACRLAKELQSLQLSQLREIEPEIAHALVGHKGRSLSFPSVRLIPLEAAGILASYDGVLQLDGLWMLDSVPLARKLFEQWKTLGHEATYPNISVEVAEALGLWPRPSSCWPPGKTRTEGGKLEWELSTKDLSNDERRAVEQWQQYSSTRAKKLNDALTLLHDSTPRVAHRRYEQESDPLILSAVRFIPQYIAEIIAWYEGTLYLDGLWLLDSIPLARRLARQWEEQGGEAKYPNITVEVAEALGIWPPPSSMWPPGKTRAEGARSHLELIADGEFLDSLDSDERYAIEQWGRYSFRRKMKRGEALRKFADRSGTKLLVLENPHLPSSASFLADMEQEFRTTWVIDEVEHPPCPVGWFYISKDGIRIGPVTLTELQAAKDRPSIYIYWQTPLAKEYELALRSGPTAECVGSLQESIQKRVMNEASAHIPDITAVRVGPPKFADEQHNEVLGLRCLQLAAQCIKGANRGRWLRVNTVEGVTALCEESERIEGIVKLGLTLCPPLKSLPNISGLDVRQASIASLHKRLEQGESLPDDVRFQIREWLNRLQGQ
jgi:hypothetical protein